MRPVKVRVPAASQRTESVASEITRPGDPGYPWANQKPAPIDVETGGAKRPLELVPLVSYRTPQRQPQLQTQLQTQLQPIMSKEPLTSQPSLNPDDVKQVPYERVRINACPIGKRFLSQALPQHTFHAEDASVQATVSGSHTYTHMGGARG